MGDGRGAGISCVNDAKKFLDAGYSGTAAEWLLVEVGRLTDHLDLMADEFSRIRAVHHDDTPHNREVKQLCERAISNTKQRVSVIEQRDKAEQKAVRQELALSPLIDLVQNYNGQSGCDCLKIIRAVLAESVRG